MNHKTYLQILSETAYCKHGNDVRL